MKQKASLFRGGMTVLAILTALSVTLTTVAQANSSLINDTLRIQTSRLVETDNGANQSTTLHFCSDYDSFEEMYRAKVQLMREIGQEGTILLKNENGTLPIASGKVTVLGAEAWRFACATGGGSMRGSMPSTTIVDALRVDGLSVSTNETDMASSDAVIVVIGRSAGEGSDMPVGDLKLTADELGMLERAKAANSRVILLSSGDYSLELAAQKADSGIGAILRVGNSGYRGAYGVADVITGKVSPSGRLVETMAADSTSSPAMENFGNFQYTNGSAIEASQAKKYVVYAESIYYDYHYYETRYEDCVLGQGNAASSAGVTVGNGNWDYADEVLWSYGYGLSYTTFEQAIQSVTFNEADHTATVTVQVTNTGTVPGKEVVQVYGQSPYTDYDRENGVEKSAIQLLGFGKTGTLVPNSSETLEITLHLQWLASYDSKGAKTYIMDAGDYYFALGNGAHEALNNILAAKNADSGKMVGTGDAALTYKWSQEKPDTETYSASLYTGASITNVLEDADINYWLEDADRITYLTRSDWTGTYPAAVELTASANMISSLNDTKKYENGVWNDTASRIAVRDVSWSNGSAALSVLSLKGLDYDDDAWNLILNNMTLAEMSNMVANGRTSIQAAASVMFPGSTGNDSPTGNAHSYVYKAIDSQTGEKTLLSAEDTVTDGITDEAVPVLGTEMNGGMYASVPTLAATFNEELARRQGEMFGEDCIYIGDAFVWGSGCNLHRAPYGGRHSEYYSADPVHTTLMAAAQTAGAWSKGTVLVNKHFAVNEQEQNRIGVATFATEQTIRECELRAFEGVFTYGDGRGLMASYNRIGLIGTASEYDLMTTVLREEWGSNCYVITDLNGPTAGLYDGNAVIAAGTSTMLNNGPYDKSSGAYVNTTLSVDSIRNDSVLRTAVQDACHRMLYNFVNSVAMNGISSSTRIETVTPWWQTALITVDALFGAATAVTMVLYLIYVNKNKEEK